MGRKGRVSITIILASFVQLLCSPCSRMPSLLGIWDLRKWYNLCERHTCTQMNLAFVQNNHIL